MRKIAEKRIGSRSFVFVGLLLLQTFICTLASQAQITTDLSPQEGTVYDRYILSITVDSTSTHDYSTPNFSGDESFSFQFSGRETAVQIVNGNMTHSVTYRYTITPGKSLKPGKYRLPNGTIEIDGQAQEIPGSLITITDQPANQAAPTVGVNFDQHVDESTPYVGQQVLYSAQITTSARVSDPQFTPLDTPGAWRETFGRNALRVRSIGNEFLRVIEERQVLYPTISGELKIPIRVAELQIAVQANRRRIPNTLGFGSNLFGGMEELFDFDPFFDTKQVSLQAKGIALKVKPLPTPPRNNLKYIPVGKISVAASLSTEETQQGDSVTLVVELYGDANLRPYELSEPFNQAASVKTYFDKPTVDILPEADRILQKKQFRISLVPQESGEIEIPRFEIVAFNPKTERYEIHQTPPRILHVRPSPNFIPAPAPTVPTKKTEDLESPKALDGELQPLRLGASVISPMKDLSAKTFYLLLALPILLALFGLLVIQRRRFADSHPEQIRARDALKKSLAEIKQLSDSNQESLRRLEAAFKGYLEERLNEPFRNLTGEECTKRLAPRLPDAELPSTVRDLVQRMEDLRFRPNQQIGAQFDDLRSAVRKCLERIEDSLPR